VTKIGTDAFATRWPFRFHEAASRDPIFRLAKLASMDYAKLMLLPKFDPPAESKGVTKADSAGRTREFFVVLAVWSLLGVLLLFLAWPNTSVPGLYYDEAECAGMAKDFLTGHAHAHMPGSAVVNLWGHPFPIFAQPYIGSLKSWLLVPSFAVFGTSLSVLRLTSLGWGLASLLIFMLWAWRWLGLNVALLAGALLALDPTYFFINILDWGLALPSFFCRFACFYFALRWWQIRKERPHPEHAAGVGKMKLGEPRNIGLTNVSGRLSNFRLHRSSVYPFVAGLFAGLGFFNKIDFSVLLAGVLLALLCCHIGRLGVNFFVRRSLVFTKPAALVIVGFLATASPILIHVPSILAYMAHAQYKPGSVQPELHEKFNAMLAMYDGSYFYRLMGAGGLFDRMYQTGSPVFAPIGIALMLGAAYLVFRSCKESSRLVRAAPGVQASRKDSGGELTAERSSENMRRALSGVGSFARDFFKNDAAFLILAILFVTCGIFLLPGATRIHHMVLVYPFPHLLVALTVSRALPQWRRRLGPDSPGKNKLTPEAALAAALFVLLLACQLLAITKTQQLIRQTGGRGRWSDALCAFAKEVAGRSDLSIVCLDWGFNEQLAFLTDGPALTEAFWINSGPAPRSTNCIYLAHPDEYRVYGFGRKFLDWSLGAGAAKVEVRPWCDRQNNVVFYSIRLRP
jgi:hypothetical protein